MPPITTIGVLVIFFAFLNKLWFFDFSFVLSWGMYPMCPQTGILLILKYLTISRILLSSPSISPESQTPFRVLYFWNNTKVLSPYVWLYCCTIIHFHILISHVLKQQQVRFKFLLSDETSRRNSFWAYSASFTDYVPHINLLSFDNFLHNLFTCGILIKIVTKCQKSDPQ